MQNIFEHIPDASQNEIFQTLLAAPNLRIERIISHGQCSPADDWYDQEQAEWVLLVEGAARIELEGGQMISLKPGDVLNIAAHQRHRVDWTQLDQRTLWLAIHYTPSKEG